MGWEVRRGKRYYYRSRRENGRVVKVYFGSGPEAEDAARADAEAAAKRRRERLETWLVKCECKAIFEADDRMKSAYEELLERTMRAAGFHKVRGRWRRKYKKCAGREAAVG